MAAGFSRDLPTSDGAHWQRVSGLVWGNRAPVASVLAWLSSGSSSAANHSVTSGLFRLWGQLELLVSSTVKWEPESVCMESAPRPQQRPWATAWAWRVETWRWPCRWGCCWHLLRPTAALFLGDCPTRYRPRISFKAEKSKNNTSLKTTGICGPQGACLS